MGTQCGAVFLFTKHKLWHLVQHDEPIADIAWVTRQPDKTLLVVATSTKTEFRNIWVTEPIKQSLVQQPQDVSLSLLLNTTRHTNPKLITSPNSTQICYLQSKFVLLWKWCDVTSYSEHLQHYGMLGFLGSALDLCFSANGRHLYLLTDRNVICVYDTTEPPESNNQTKLLQEYIGLKGSKLIHRDIIRTIMLFRLHLRNFQPIAVFPLHQDSSPARVVTCSRHHIAIGKKDGTIELLDEPTTVTLKLKEIQLALAQIPNDDVEMKRTPIPRRKSFDEAKMRKFVIQRQTKSPPSN